MEVRFEHFFGVQQFSLLVDCFTERELITPPLNGLILPGITRDSILHLAREWRQFKVTERTITMSEIKKALHQGRVSCINHLKPFTA